MSVCSILLPPPTDYHHGTSAIELVSGLSSRYSSALLAVTQMQTLELILNVLPSLPITSWGCSTGALLKHLWTALGVQIYSINQQVLSLGWKSSQCHYLSVPFSQMMNENKVGIHAEWWIYFSTCTSNQMKTIFLHIFSSSSVKGTILCLIPFKMVMVWILDTLIMV